MTLTQKQKLLEEIKEKELTRLSLMTVGQLLDEANEWFDAELRTVDDNLLTDLLAYIMECTEGEEIPELKTRLERMEEESKS